MGVSALNVALPLSLKSGVKGGAKPGYSYLEDNSTQSSVSNMRYPRKSSTRGAHQTLTEPYVCHVQTTEGERSLPT